MRAGCHHRDNGNGVRDFFEIELETRKNIFLVFFGLNYILLAVMISIYICLNKGFLRTIFAHH